MNNKILSLSHKRQFNSLQKPFSELIEEIKYTQQIKNMCKSILEDAEYMAVLRDEVYLDNQELIKATYDYEQALDAFNRACLHYKLELSIFKYNGVSCIN